MRAKTDLIAPLLPRSRLPRSSKELSMQTVVGIFASRPSLNRAVAQVKSAGVDPERIKVLLPGSAEPANVQVSDTEQPGMGTALGSVVGGAAGAIAGTLVLPVVGTAIGLAAAATFAAAGTVGGALAGAALEAELEDGLPADEIYVYEDALRK